MKTRTKLRKVIRSGPALIITLPRDFVRDSGLKKGDTVAVTYDSILVIVTPQIPEEKDK